MKKRSVVWLVMFVLTMFGWGHPIKSQAVSTEEYYKTHGDFQSERNVIQVADWASFIKAYQNETVTKIILTKDIEDGSKNGAVGPMNYQRKSSLEIDGQGHTLTLKQYHGLRTSEQATGYTETIADKKVPRSIFHMHDISLRQNLNGVQTAAAHYSSFAFVGASDVHASWNLESAKYEQNMTKNWYFRFGNVDTKNDNNDDNAKGVARLVMAYSAEVSVYGKLDLSTSAENMYVGSLIVEDDTNWTGVTEHYDYSTVWFAIASQPNSTGRTEELTIGKNSQVNLSNMKRGTNFPGFYGHYKEAVIGENSRISVKNKGVAWQFEQDNSSLEIQKGASLELTSTGKGKVVQFGRGFLSPKKITNSHLVVKSGGALLVKGATDGAGNLSVVDFNGGLMNSTSKAYQATNSSILVENGGIFDIQNITESKKIDRRRVLNLRNNSNSIQFQQSPVYLWETKQALGDLEQAPKMQLPKKEEYEVKGEAAHTFVLDNSVTSYSNKDYRRISTVLGIHDDFDGDGLTNEQELAIGTDPNNPDTDGDGLPDDLEWNDTLTDPTKPDSEGDGILDGDRDNDEDGVTNQQELIDKTDPRKVDTDGDGITDGEEKRLGTDPLKRDTDGDGLSDGDEIKLSLDPLTPKTDGNTLDSERKIQQTLSDQLVNEQFFEEGSAFVPKLSGNVTRVLDKQASIEVSSVDQFDSQRSLIGTPIKLETEIEAGDLTLEFDLSKSSHTADMKQLLVCQYIDNSLKPLPTTVFDNHVSAPVSTEGVYLVIDNELFLKSLGINVLSDVKKAMTRAIQPNLQVKESNTSETSAVDKEEQTREPAQEIPNTTWEDVRPPLNEAKLMQRLNLGTKGLADIVFVIDRSGSMDSSINNVKNNINQFVDELTNVYQVDVNFGLVAYTDNEVALIPDGKNEFFTNSTKFKDQLGKLYTSGGTEYVTRALEIGRTLNYRPNAGKYMILLTDESGDFGSKDPSIAEMASLLERDEITTSVITEAGLKRNYQPLFSQTGGIYANIYGNFSVELLKIAENIGEDVNNGTWVMLSDFQAVRLDDTKDTDKDGLLDEEELGKKISKDLSPFIESLCKANGVPSDLYQGNKTIEVYDYQSNPVLSDTDYDGIGDKEDQEKKNNTFSDQLTASKDDQIATIDVSYQFDYRKFFKASNKAYHRDISMLGSLVSATAYNGRKFKGIEMPKDYEEEETKAAEMLLKKHGMHDVKHIDLSDLEKEPGVKTYTDDDVSEIILGHRKITYKGKEKEIIFISVRGTNGSVEEWSSNFDVGSTTEEYWDKDNEEWTNKAHHKGFDVTANRLHEHIQKYIKDNKLDKPAIDKVMYIIGHSRGAALANLLGAKYEDNPDYQTFVYTYATPNTTTQTKKYQTIFNLVNEDDIVPFMPLEEWSFGRYGKTKSISVERAYEDQRWIHADDYSDAKKGTFEWLTAKDYNNDGGKERTLKEFGKLAHNRHELYQYKENNPSIVYQGDENAYKENVEERLARFTKYELTPYSSKIRVYQTPAFVLQDIALLAGRENLTITKGEIGKNVAIEYEKAKWSFLRTSGMGGNVPVYGGIAHPHIPQTYYLLSRNNFVPLD
jgi:Mg-chelatase subunit ChlD